MITFTSVYKFLEFEIDLYILTNKHLNIPDSPKPLTKTQKKVLIATILCQMKNIDINSTDGIEYVRDSCEFYSSTDVWAYRWKLSKLGWFISLKTTPDKKKSVYKLIDKFDLSVYNFIPSKQELVKYSYKQNK